MLEIRERSTSPIVSTHRSQDLGNPLVPLLYSLDWAELMTTNYIETMNYLELEVYLC